MKMKNSKDAQTHAMITEPAQTTIPSLTISVQTAAALFLPAFAKMDTSDTKKSVSLKRFARKLAKTGRKEFAKLVAILITRHTTALDLTLWEPANTFCQESMTTLKIIPKEKGFLALLCQSNIARLGLQESKWR